MAALPDRHVPFEGCFNFRDLGGYRAAGGRSVRWRMLYRSDGLSRLTLGDLETLDNLGLRTVVDLRTEAEVRRGRIDTDGRDLTYHHLPMIDVLPPVDDLDRWADPAYVAAEYTGMLRSGGPSLASAIGLLSDPASYPLAYHCMAGKDRTGILSALVLGLLGVAEDDIVADYALSAAAMARMVAWLRATDPATADKVGDGPAVVGAERATMVAFLDALRAEHGGIDGYVEAIGAPGAGARLRDLLLEP